MTISVDYSQFPYLITILKSDLTLVTGNEYKITVSELWVLLRDYADSEEAVPFPVIYENVPPDDSGTPRVVRINANYYQAQFPEDSPLYNVEITEGNTNFRAVEKKNSIGVGTNNVTGYSIVETGVSGLTSEESTWLASVPTIEVDMAFLKYSLKGEKALEKTGSTWYLKIWDTNSPRNLILNKALKDVFDSDIDDLAAGALGKEEGSTV